jgi:hypothetical protein
MRVGISEGGSNPRTDVGLFAWCRANFLLYPRRPRSAAGLNLQSHPSWPWNQPRYGG